MLHDQVDHDEQHDREDQHRPGDEPDEAGGVHHGRAAYDEPGDQHDRGGQRHRPGGQAEHDRRTDQDDDGGGEPQQHRVVRRKPARHRVGAAQLATVTDDEHRHHDDEDGQLGGPGLADEPGRAQPEVLLRQQVGQVGHRQQQRGGVGQPDRRERERQRAQPQLRGHREADRREQHGGGVDAEHPRRDRRERREQQEQRDPAAAGDPGGDVRRDVEQPRVVAQVGDHLDQHQEQQDRPDALRDVEEPDAHRPVLNGAGWSATGCPSGGTRSRAEAGWPP